MTDVAIIRRSITLDETGGRGRDGVSGDAVAIEQTNSNGAAVQAQVVSEGAAFGADTLYKFKVAYETAADSMTFEIAGWNDGDPRLAKIAGTMSNFDPKALSVGDTVLLSYVSAGDRLGVWDVVFPSAALASADETREAFVPHGGRTDASVTPAALSDVLEVLGVMLHRNRFLRPTKAEPYVLWKASENRILEVTRVKGGSRQDYCVHEFIDQVPLSGPVLANCLRYNGCLGAFIDGVWEEPANFSGEPDESGNLDSMNPPVFEPVYRIGPHSAYPSGFDFGGPGHWHLSNGTCGIYLNGDTGTNYRLDENFPVGTALRCASWQIDQSFTALLPDNVTVAGTYVLAHLSTDGGVQISGRLTITGSDIGMTNFYGAMISSRCDTYKAAGLNAISATAEDGFDYGLSGGVKTKDANLGEAASFQFYWLARNTHVFKAVLNGGTGPIRVDASLGGTYSWAENGSNRDSWLQERAEGYGKGYVSGVNKSTSWLVDGKTFDFNVSYIMESGAPV